MITAYIKNYPNKIVQFLETNLYNNNSYNNNDLIITIFYYILINIIFIKYVYINVQCSQ